MLSKAKRKQMEDMIYKTFDLLDPTGKNTLKYRQLLSKMPDDKFDKFMKKFLENPDENFYLEIEPYENEPGMDDILSAAKYLGVPIFERVVMPFQNPGGEPVVTQEEVPVIHIHLKRVQQMVAKKNSMSIHIDKRNPKTGRFAHHGSNAMCASFLIAGRALELSILN